ncbi:hypothetical protein [Streptomyces rimosus]|uniref:hypothetical protein n=1 Tax=Streptomyces rimosus TaxID=1927 RepID=UPI00379BACEF
MAISSHIGEKNSCSSHAVISARLPQPDSDAGQDRDALSSAWAEADGEQPCDGFTDTVL